MTRNDKFIDGLRRRSELEIKTKRIVSKKLGDNFEQKMPRRVREQIQNIKKIHSLPSRRIEIKESEEVRAEQEAELAADFVQPIRTLELETDMEINSDELMQNKRERRNKLNTDEELPKKRGIKPGRIIVVFVVILLIGAGVAYVWGDQIISKLTGGRSGLFDVIKLATEEAKPLKMDEKGRTNILAFGTSGYDMSGTGHDGAQLTDSIMVISMDQKTKDVAMLSLPRDLKSKRACAAGKINEVYWCKNQNGKMETEGAEALEKEVGEILGINFHYHAHINWGALVRLVDTLGGITVTLDEDINDEMTKTYIKAGKPTILNGERALGLARARYGTTSGDFTRGSSQQKILMAVAEKIMNKGLGLTEILDLSNLLGDNLRTNFTIEEMKSGVNLMKNVDLQSLRQVPLINTEDGDYVKPANINEVSYVIPTAGSHKYSEIQKYVAKMFSSDPMMRENAKIGVFNGSGAVGVATAEGRKLEERNLRVEKVGDAPEGDYTEKIYVYDLTNQNPGTKKLMEEIYKGVEVRTKETLPKELQISGLDFVIIIGKNEG